MELSKNYLNKFTVKKVNEEFEKNKELAESIYKHFGKSIAFPRIMKLIKGYGYQFVYETFNEVKRADCNNSIALFLWKIGQVKINWVK